MGTLITNQCFSVVWPIKERVEAITENNGLPEIGNCSVFYSGFGCTYYIKRYKTVIQRKMSTILFFFVTSKRELRDRILDERNHELFLRKRHVSVIEKGLVRGSWKRIGSYPHGIQMIVHNPCILRPITAFGARGCPVFIKPSILIPNRTDVPDDSRRASNK